MNSAIASWVGGNKEIYVTERYEEKGVAEIHDHRRPEGTLRKRIRK